MNDYLLLMHNDAQDVAAADNDTAWGRYLGWLRGSGQFDGGSGIGGGVCCKQSGVAGSISAHLTGYLRLRAASIEDARRLLVGNPVFEAGGTVEIRELPRS